MSDRLTQILDRIAPKALPAFDRTWKRLADLERRPNVSATRVCEVVLTDPGLTVHLLRTAAERFGHRAGGEVTTISHALLLLGMGQAAGLARKLPTISTIRDPKARRGFSSCAARAFHAGLQAHEWAVRRHEGKPEEVFVSAQLSHVGELAVWAFMPTLAPLIGGHWTHLDRSGTGYRPNGADVSLAELGQGLARAWHLPPAVQSCLAPRNALDPHHVGAFLAARLARAAALDWESEETRACVELAEDCLAVDGDEAAAHVHSVGAWSARVVAFLGVPTAGHTLINKPAPPESSRARAVAPEGKARRPEHETVKSARNAPSSRTPVAKISQREQKLLPVPAVYQRWLAKLARPQEESSSAQQMINGAIEALNIGLGLDVATVALLSADRTQLRGRYSSRKGDTETLARLNLSLSRPHLFTRMTRKPSAVWLNHQTRPSLLPLLPPGFRAVGAARDFFAMSVFVHGQPVALLFADGGRGSPRFNAESYARFKRLCTVLAGALEWAATARKRARAGAQA